MEYTLDDMRSYNKGIVGLSPITLLRYAALCTVGQLARKIS